MNEEIKFLSIEDARVLYANVTGKSAPRSLKIDLLRRAIHWHAQCICYNVSKRRTNIHVNAAPIRIKSIAADPPTGSLLLKEWRGTVHEVHRTAENQYAYNGMNFSSLSAVANFITGCKRSGPRFFDLTNRIERRIS